MTERPPLRIAVVGPCAAGKSTLVSVLRKAGYDARHVAQEHSYVPDMWKRVSRPDILVFLDVDLEAIWGRRPRLQLRGDHLAEQRRRLEHARQHCDLYVDTGDMSPAEVEKLVFSFLDTAPTAEEVQE